MKTLNECINEHIKLPNIKNDLTELRKKYTGKQYEYELNFPVLVESSFDKFVELNNITLIDDKVYDYYLNENFNNDSMRSYMLYQYKLYNKLYDKLYESKDITNYVYNDLNGILYHITLIDTYKRKILNKELVPKWKGLKYNDQFRDGRIFFIGNTNENEIKHQLKSIKNTSVQLKNNQCIVLKINLNKYKNKIRFRIDSSASGYNAYFTEEPIPDFCITPIDLDTWDYINKKELS